MSTTGHRAPKAPVGQHWAWRPTSEVERNHQWEVLAPGDRAQPCRWGTRPGKACVDTPAVLAGLGRRRRHLGCGRWMDMGVAVMMPPFAYFGGKSRLAERIAATFPAHSHYVEPYAGSLAVLLAKAPSRMETVNDLDGDLMTFWRVLREQPDDLIRACAFTPHSRGEYALSFDRPTDLSDLERARRTWVNLAQGRSGTLASTGWRYKKTLIKSASGGDGILTARLASQVDKMGAVAARLSKVTLECKPALDLIALYGAHEDVLLYVDPPYLASVRAGGNYRYEMSGVPEHRELAEALRSCRATVVLSGYSSPLYSEMYADWHITSMASFTTQGGAAKATAEVLWSNRAPVADLFGEAVS